MSVSLGLGVGGHRQLASLGGGGGRSACGGEAGGLLYVPVPTTRANRMTVRWRVNMVACATCVGDGWPVRVRGGGQVVGRGGCLVDKRRLSHAPLIGQERGGSRDRTSTTATTASSSRWPKGLWGLGWR